MSLAEQTLIAIAQAEDKARIQDVGALAVVGALMVDSANERANIHTLLTRSLVKAAFEAGFKAGTYAGAEAKEKEVKNVLGIKEKTMYSEPSQKESLFEFVRNNKEQLQMTEDDVKEMEINYWE